MQNISKIIFLLMLGLLGVGGYAQTKKTPVTKTQKVVTKKPIVRNTAVAVALDSIDKATGLSNDAHLKYVVANCTGCHSSKLILQHRFSRDEWKDKIRWMQRYHKLWDLGSSEKYVLDYLEKYYSTPVNTRVSAHRQKALKEFVWYKLEGEKP